MTNLEVSTSKDGWKKYPTYELDTDPEQDDKAREIRLCSFARPHMRAFHCSWWSFFIAFFIWFAISPLLSEIRTDLGLTKKEIWTSSIAGVGSTIGVRFLVSCSVLFVFRWHLLVGRPSLITHVLLFLARCLVRQVWCENPLFSSFVLCFHPNRLHRLNPDGLGSLYLACFHWCGGGYLCHVPILDQSSVLQGSGRNCKRL